MIILDYSYSPHAIPTAIVAVSVLVLGIWVLIRERISRVSILLFLLTLFIGIWFSAFSLMYNATTGPEALYWARIAYLGVPFIPAAVYHFSVAVLRICAQRKRLVWLIWTASAVFVFAIVGTDTLIRQVYHYWWGYYPKYGWLSVPYLSFFFGVTILALREYWAAYKKTVPSLHRLRIKWFMIAFGVLSLGSIDYLAKFGIAVYPVGFLPVLIFLIIASQTIKRHRLADLTPQFAASQILETMQGAVLVADMQGDIRVINRAACAMLGYHEAELLGTPLARIIGLSPDGSITPVPAGTHDVDMPWRMKSGNCIDVSVSTSLVTDQDAIPVGVVYAGIDVIERKRAAEARASEERYALAVRGARDGLWDWNLKTGEIYYSSRWKTMLGYTDQQIETTPAAWFERVHSEDQTRVQAEIAAHLAGHTPHYESEYRMLHGDGAYRWILSRGVAVFDHTGKALRIAGSQTDVTERKSTARQLIRQTLYDPLTQLPNRTYFVDKLDLALARAKRYSNYTFAVLFLDLDRFKVVNEGLGHMIGDQLLISIARRLESCLRPGDTLARFGGDEFTVLLDGIEDTQETTRLTNRIQEQLMLPFNLQGHRIFTTASIGIAQSSTGYQLAEELLRDADTAMYRAKEKGKARAEIFDSNMHAHALGLWKLEADMRRGIELGEFRIHYQPLVSLASGQIIGAEALVRWQHPSRGLVYPLEFISLAEETGLIRPLGHWLLRAACAQNKAWRDAGYSLCMAVNFSAHQFQDRDLLNNIKEVLFETGLPAHALDLEITESVAMHNVQYGMVTLQKLSDMGVHISIDDFGTGYSSLAYLKRFPIDNLKIDQSFMKDVSNDADNGALTRAIITMAHSLKLSVIAEGVETSEQLSFLRAQGCDQMQGYLVSQPVPAELFTRLLKLGTGLPPVPAAKKKARIKAV